MKQLNPPIAMLLYTNDGVLWLEIMTSVKEMGVEEVDLAVILMTIFH